MQISLPSPFHADKVLKDGDGKEDQNHQRPSARGTEHYFFFLRKDYECIHSSELFL